MIKIIVAYDLNRGIGFNGDLLYKIPDDLRRFKELTKNNVVVMGRKTFESIGSKPLPNRNNIVLTKEINEDDCTFDFKSNQSLHFKKRFATTFWTDFLSCFNKDIWIIGGEQIYKYFLETDLVDEIHATIINSYRQADTHFPQLDSKKWKIKEIIYNNHEIHPYSFVTFVREK